MSDTQPVPLADVIGKLPILEVLKKVEAGEVVLPPAPTNGAAESKPSTPPMPIRVPPAYRHCTLENYKPVTKSQRMALRYATRFAEVVVARKDGPAPMVALCGTEGSGKSHLLYAAGKAIATGRPTVRVFDTPWYELADQLRYSEWPEVARLKRRIYKSQLLLLDEVRATSGSAFDDTILAQVSCWAWAENVPVMLTTNVHPLSDLIGRAAASRYMVVLVNGPDHRQGGVGE